MSATQLTMSRRSGTRAVIGVAAAVVACALALLAASGPPANWELRSFRTINELPSWLYVVLWPLMQYGQLAAIPLVTTLTWLAKRRRLAAGLGTAALAGYILAKVAKQVVGRGRPGAFLDGVIEREIFGEGSLGYPSGHAVVAATFTTALLPAVRRPYRIALVLLTLAVLFGRVYIGAHLALDVLGGAAIGVALGTAVTLAVDAWSEQREADHVR